MAPKKAPAKASAPAKGTAAAKRKAPERSSLALSYEGLPPPEPRWARIPLQIWRRDVQAQGCTAARTDRLSPLAARRPPARRRGPCALLPTKSPPAFEQGQVIDCLVATTDHLHSSPERAGVRCLAAACVPILSIEQRRGQPALAPCAAECISPRAPLSQAKCFYPATPPCLTALCAQALAFMVLDIVEEGGGRFGLWGATAAGAAVHVRVADFAPYMYIAAPKQPVRRWSGPFPPPLLFMRSCVRGAACCPSSRTFLGAAVSCEDALCK